MRFYERPWKTIVQDKSHFCHFFSEFFTFYLPNCCKLNTILSGVDINSFSDAIVAGNNFSVKPVRFYVLSIETNLEPSIPNCEKNKKFYSVLFAFCCVVSPV